MFVVYNSHLTQWLEQVCDLVGCLPFISNMAWLTITYIQHIYLERDYRCSKDLSLAITESSNFIMNVVPLCQ